MLIINAILKMQCVCASLFIFVNATTQQGHFFRSGILSNVMTQGLDHESVTIQSWHCLTSGLDHESVIIQSWHCLTSGLDHESVIIQSWHCLTSGLDHDVIITNINK